MQLDRIDSVQPDQAEDNSNYADVNDQIRHDRWKANMVKDKERQQAPMEQTFAEKEMSSNNTFGSGKSMRSNAMSRSKAGCSSVRHSTTIKSLGRFRPAPQLPEEDKSRNGSVPQCLLPQEQADRRTKRNLQSEKYVGNQKRGFKPKFSHPQSRTKEQKVDANRRDSRDLRFDNPYKGRRTSKKEIRKGDRTDNSENLRKMFFQTRI